MDYTHNGSSEADHSIRAQLDRIERSTARTERAVFGEMASGLPGLVDDVRHLKEYRDSQKMTAAWVAGGVAALVLGAKAALAKFFS